MTPEEKEMKEALDLAVETTKEIIVAYEDLLEHYRKALEVLEKYVSLSYIMEKNLIKISCERQEKKGEVKNNASSYSS